MRICISRIDKMGDMILSLPAIKSIKINNPNIFIKLLASENNSRLLNNITYIDEIEVIKTKKNVFSIIKLLYRFRKQRYDFYINLSPTVLSYIFCYFSNSNKKATLIFFSRYKKNNFSKFIIKFFSYCFCNIVKIIDRKKRFKENKDLHQTNMIFELLDQCKIKTHKNVDIDIPLPQDKIQIKNNQKIITIHIPSKWINSFYSEYDFLNLLERLPKENFIYLLTTDESSKKVFNEIFNKYLIIDNNNINNIENTNKKIIILDKFNFPNWLKIIYSSHYIITAECGCSHIAAACKVPVNIIYDADNLPEYIYKEYAPWNSEHKKFIFGN